MRAAAMVICRLSSLLGERRLKVSDVVRDTGIARATVDRYYYDTVQSYDREVLDKLCQYLKVDLPALIQYVRHPDLFDEPAAALTAQSPVAPYVVPATKPAKKVATRQSKAQPKQK
jgi:putative transcriptional regulator